ncbi:hypothetical protein RUE5091_04404 [Ruegeria denitrificans]|uniref:Uncharacterized protein n=1 Tax=Ruegeria denitrificans TaxID=1715692 RepID=A0A0P1IQF7_9RHOB|nr:hypothetical protein RUE5091_04404 [Ruegeria denitrificans]
MSVLVVDDEPGMRNFLPKALKKPLRHGRLRIKAPDLTIMHERDLPAAKRVAIVAAGGRSG